MRVLTFWTYDLSIINLLSDSTYQNPVEIAELTSSKGHKELVKAPVGLHLVVIQSLWVILR